MNAGRAAAGARRIRAIMIKDAAELLRHPGTLVPPLVMILAALVPAFLITIVAPRLSGESLAEGELADAARRTIAVVPELAGLDGSALVQAFLFHQFLLLLSLVPVVGAMSLAAHAIIGEKQARALEPLLATPITTAELLAAKTLTPFLISLALLGLAMALYLAGIAATAEPGVWHTFLGPRTLVLVGLGAPLVSLVGLQSSVLVSSRVNDPRSAQQLGSLVIAPITFAFVVQVLGQYMWGLSSLLATLAVLVLVNAALLAVGVRVFKRERVVVEWK